MLPLRWKGLAAIPTQVYVYGGIMAVAVGGYVAFVAHERAVGARDATIAAQRVVIDSLNKVVVPQREKLRADTVRLTKLLTRWDSVYQAIHDTVLVSRTDTVRVPVAVLVTADSTIRVCRETVADCTKLAQTERARADALAAQNTALKHQLPSTTGTWLTRAVWGLGGLALGHYVR